MSNKKTSVSSQLPNLQSPPDWADESRPYVEAWIRPTEGLVVTGRIVGYFAFLVRERGERDRMRDVACVKISAPTRAVRPGNAEPTEVPAGTIVGVSLIPALENLRYYIEKRGEIWVRYDRKELLGNHYSVWRCTVRCRGIRSAQPLREQQTIDTTSDTTSDDMPF